MSTDTDEDGDGDGNDNGSGGGCGSDDGGGEWSELNGSCGKGVNSIYTVWAHENDMW